MTRTTLRPVMVPETPIRATSALGAAPMLEWLKVTDLVIDDRYQRELKPGNWKAIRRIAGAFRWSRFSTVFVSALEGGSYAIIDGQHRVHAAALRGIERVPCQIVQMDVRDQAASFAAINGLVTKVTPWQLLRASVEAGEAWALECVTACEAGGCRLMTSNTSTDLKKPGEIFAIGLIRKLIANGHKSGVILGLRALRGSEFGTTADAYSNDVLRPWLAAVSDRPWLVRQQPDLSPFVDTFDIYAAIDNAAEYAKAKRRTGVNDISRFDIAVAEIGSGLDQAFPQRMALPKAGAA